MRCAVTQPTIVEASARVRHALGAHFDQEFASGAALSLPEALDLASDVLSTRTA